jgi:hypothetical protein
MIDSTNATNPKYRLEAVGRRRRGEEKIGRRGESGGRRMLKK